MEDYTERYSGIRVTRPVISMEEVRETAGSSCVFNVDRVRYRDMKGKNVLVIGVVVELSNINGKQSAEQIVLWNFGMRKCSILIGKKIEADALPVAKGTVLLVAHPSLEIHNGQLILVCETHTTIKVIGLAKDYGVCGHTDKDGKKCSSHLDKRCGVLCADHSKVELSRLQRAQSMRPELKGSWIGLTQTYGFLQSRGGKKRTLTSIDSPGDEYRVKRKINKQKDDTEMLELAEKAQSRASKLALLGCVENMRGLRKGTLKEKYVQVQCNPPNPTKKDNPSPASKEEPKKAGEGTMVDQNVQGIKDWEIDVVGYNSDQNSRSFWVEGENTSPFVGAGTPCSKYVHKAFNKQNSPYIRRIPPIWEIPDGELDDKQSAETG